MNLTKKLIPINFETRTNRRLGVCIHTMVGFLDGTDSFFRNPDAKASSHYGVDLKTDRIYQWVEEKHIAWAQGRRSGVTNALAIEQGGNCNDYFISIESADDRDPANADRTLQTKTLIELVTDICRRNNIPADRKHICGHREIYNVKSCPGNLDVDFIVREVAKNLQPTNGGTTITPMDQFEENGLKALREYRKIRPQPEGNFEGFVNSIIGNDKQHNDLASAASKVEGLETLLKTKETAIESMKDQIKVLETQVKNPPVTPAPEPVFTNPVAAFFYKMAKFAQD